MKRRTVHWLWYLLPLGSVMLLMAPASTRGQNGIAFNGTYYASPSISAGTSKLENTTANVLNGVTQLTVCCWIYPNGPGESDTGTVFLLDEQIGQAAFVIRRTATNTLTIIKYPGPSGQFGQWTIPIVDGTWNALCVCHDFTTDAAPTAQVNFTAVTVTQVGSAPSGIQDLPATGYCVGNNGIQGHTWNGRIAHVQVFNTILSDDNAETALRNPGSYTSGLRLYLPMRNAADLSDHSGNAFHGTGTDLENGSNFPPFGSMFHFDAASRTLGQLVIATNGTEPAGGVIGVGMRTKLTASNALQSNSRFISTEGWGGTSTVIEPTVRDVYVYGNQGIPDHPSGNSTELAMGNNPVCHAIAVDGDAATVTGCKVFDFRGDGIHVANSTDEYSRMIRMPRVTNNRISHCWTGIRAGAVDTQVDGNRIANVRDICIHGVAGSIQCSNNHAFGAQTAIQFEGGPSRSIGDRFSDAKYGFKVLAAASGSDIIGGTTEHCEIKNIDVHAQRVHIENCRILVANSSTQAPGIIGCDLHYEDGSRAVMTDCEVAFPDCSFGGHSGIDRKSVV